MIKVFVSQNPTQDPVASVFTFTSPSARVDCDTIKEAIQTAIAERNRPKTVADVLKDGEEGLLRNTDVQMSLLKQDVELSRMFKSLVIEGKQLTAEQFWRARVHLLRAHAIERTQQRGPYNVLAELKPKTQDGTTKVSLSADRIRDIFEQHPLIKRVYDESVPKVPRLDSMGLW
jgi:transcription initiation factor TFIIH subunit 1